MASFVHHRYSSSGAQCILFVCASCIYAITRPYKLNFRTSIDILIFALLEILTVELLFSVNHAAIPAFIYYIFGSVLLLGVPHMALICYVLANKAGITQCLKGKLNRWVQSKRRKSQADMDVEAETDTGSLPDRLVNPVDYEPVLLTRKHTAVESAQDKRLTQVHTYGSI